MVPGTLIFTSKRHILILAAWLAHFERLDLLDKPSVELWMQLIAETLIAMRKTHFFIEPSEMGKVRVFEHT